MSNKNRRFHVVAAMVVGASAVGMLTGCEGTTQVGDDTSVRASELVVHVTSDGRCVLTNGNNELAAKVVDARTISVPIDPGRLILHYWNERAGSPIRFLMYEESLFPVRKLDDEVRAGEYLKGTQTVEPVIGKEFQIYWSQSVGDREKCGSSFRIVQAA